MSKSTFFQEHVVDFNTNDIYEKISDTFDFSLLEKELSIDYDKFPNELPYIDGDIKSLYEKYYYNLEQEGYKYNSKGDNHINKYLFISPKFQQGTSWVKGIKQKTILSNALNIHIFLNDPGVHFEYFCPFNNDIVSVKCQAGKAVVYPNFWGSLFKHLTFEKNVVYLNCTIGLPQ